MFIGIEGELASPIYGFAGSFGITIDLEHPMESGITVGGGPAFGLSAGFSPIAVGVYLENEGMAIEGDANLGPISASASYFLDDTQPDLLSACQKGGWNGAEPSFGEGVGGVISLKKNYTYSGNDFRRDIGF